MQMKLAHIPNILSAVRCLMGLLLFLYPPLLSLPYVFIGGLTDFADGWIARRYRISSRLGTWLDPLGDKLFAAAVVYTLWNLSLLQPWQIAALFSRDIALVLFGLEIGLFGQYRRWSVQSFMFGKWATALQFLLFMILITAGSLPDYVYLIMGALGPLCFIELNLLLLRRN